MSQIDKSHLPHVYDVCQCFSVLEDGALAHSLQEQEIEQFYNSNLQKNQAVQSDVRLARRLQDEEEEEEEERVQLTQQLQQLEEQDCEYARMIQEELRRCDEEDQRREEEDEEMAKRLQEEEESMIRQERAEAGHHEDRGDSLLSQGLGLWEQMMQDAELARRLQEEEDTLPHRRITETDVDFRTVQVAQDEELARYMQRQEKKSSRRSCDLFALERSPDPRGRRVPRERLNSDGLHSPVEEEQSQDNQHSLIPTCTTLHAHPFHNIAEELDPTFTGRKRETGISTSPSSGICLAPRTPHSVFYDYLPEPSAIPPIRRQADRPGRLKPKEKRDSCKQQ
ncbi:coiled-coil domain-containing protein 50 [Tachysurus vachellii]|uniref:coiled-coil domain-containing protein 50 n=1 Tax=Tachysurus vachellii TaxID=175792 RepID=UPI00296B5467|nr:coiled-coil domain-containing protein 50 [Tachysurus vachellii]XP_060714087.1 coiled-coil domain-containing protein 50 [Tachysurus vachellii]